MTFCCFINFSSGKFLQTFSTFEFYCGTQAKQKHQRYTALLQIHPRSLGSKLNNFILKIKNKHYLHAPLSVYSYITAAHFWLLKSRCLFVITVFLFLFRCDHFSAGLTYWMLNPKVQFSYSALWRHLSQAGQKHYITWSVVHMHESYSLLWRFLLMPRAAAGRKTLMILPRLRCPVMVSLPFCCCIISGSLLSLMCHLVCHRVNEELIVQAAADTTATLISLET